MSLTGGGDGGVLFLVHAVQNGQQTPASKKSTLFGNPYVREMMVIVRQKAAEEIAENAEVTDVYKLHCHVPTDDVSIVLELKPDPYHWLPVAGGVPMPERYLQQHAEMAPMLEVAEILKSMLRCAGVLRRFMSTVGGTDDDLEDVGGWLPFEDAVGIAIAKWSENAEKLESMPLAGASCSKTKDCLRMVCEALWGDNSALWSILLFLCGQAHMGSRIASITGPVGAGKSFALVAFAALGFILGDARVCILCQMNAPLDDTARKAFAVLKSAGFLKRVASLSHYQKVIYESEEEWHDCLTRLTAPLDVPSGNVLLLATTALASMTRSGRPILPSGSVKFIFQDESQSEGGYESLMVPHLLQEDGMMVYVHDDAQFPPHERPAFRDTMLGALMRNFYSGSWPVPYLGATANPPHYGTLAQESGKARRRIPWFAHVSLSRQLRDGQCDFQCTSWLPQRVPVLRNGTRR